MTRGGPRLAAIALAAATAVALRYAPAAAAIERVATQAPLSDFLILRHRQYAETFAVGGAVLLVLVIAALLRRRRGAFGAGLAALGALGIGALLQFSATSGIASVMWPPPYLWLGTFMLAVMFAAVAAVMLRPGLRRGVGAVLIAEAIWWAVPLLSAVDAFGFGADQPSFSMDWLVFLGTAAGALAAPAAAWALASLCAMIAERIIPAHKSSLAE